MHIKDMDLDKVKRIHMIGIGGIGMSGLARILLDKDIKITGSDLKNNRLIDNLRKKGCRITIGHSAICGRPNAVIRSYGVKDDNPEIIQAKIKKIPIIERSELLKKIFETKEQSISVTGTHGKTTTTAMISYLFDKAGLKPTVLIGGEMDYFDGNAKSGDSNILISEVDESDGYFSKIYSRYAIVTNVEKEHMEHYKDIKKLFNAFRDFIKIQKNGTLIYNKDDKNLRSLVKEHKGHSISFGSSRDCDFYPLSISERGLSTEFICFNKKKKLGKISLAIPGKHNIFNSLAVIGCALEFGMKFDRIRDILKNFKGVKRRFEIKSRGKGIILVEDYAHHPTEIKAVIDIALKLKRSRLVCVFQPHRFTRTFYLEKEFSKSFNGVDELILTDIYAASESPIKGVSAKNIYYGVRKERVRHVKLMPKESIAEYLKYSVKNGDVILVLGAGDINGIIPDIKRYIKRKS